MDLTPVHSFVTLIGPESEYHDEAIERFQSLCAVRFVPLPHCLNEVGVLTGGVGTEANRKCGSPGERAAAPSPYRPCRSRERIRSYSLYQCGPRTRGLGYRRA
jgi:hypothetical protein